MKVREGLLYSQYDFEVNWV